MKPENENLLSETPTPIDEDEQSTLNQEAENIDSGSVPHDVVNVDVTFDGEIEDFTPEHEEELKENISRRLRISKKLISLETLIVLFLKFFIFLDETIYFAPLLRALPANFTPSLFFPFIVKNKLFFVTCLESIANP